MRQLKKFRSCVNLHHHAPAASATDETCADLVHESQRSEVHPKLPDALGSRGDTMSKAVKKFRSHVDSQSSDLSLHDGLDQFASELPSKSRESAHLDDVETRSSGASSSQDQAEEASEQAHEAKSAHRPVRPP